MKLLLDTRILLWWLDANPLLPRDAMALIRDPQNTIFVSAVSLCEIWLKQSLGKLRLPASFQERLASEGFENLPLTSAQSARIGQMEWMHRDPFDRMLVAQAQAENLTFLTADEALAGYGPVVRVAR
ncbi:MAG TPA: type II toxin-antitoxin system VapC family toxin [Bryobacteraceae bacterium]|nr:type II toxin-antitoxin system VapC family toxin [Bryobacteraceae bacterium]